MFNKIYGSWEALQKEKFEKIFQRLGTGFFDRKLVLDIGAGSGYLEEFLDTNGISTDIIALEPEISMIKNRKNFILGRAEEMPFREAAFDIAFIVDTVHLVEKISSDCMKKAAMLVATMFYNDANYSEKRMQIMEKLGDFDIMDEFTLDTKEKELVIIARKK